MSDHPMDQAVALATPLALAEQPQGFVAKMGALPAAAKMKLMDYGPHGNREASEEERAATLHMITASYCGDGHSFTTSGTAVAWRNDDDTVLPPFMETRLEDAGDQRKCLPWPNTLPP